MAITGTLKVENGTLSEKELLVLNTILENGSYTYDDMSQKISVPKRTLTRIVSSLVDQGFLVREGSKKYGKWIVLK